MESGVWIAIISAFGVIGSSLLQWRSNIKTLNSAAISADKERNDRAAQSIREAEERQKIRAEEREAEAVKSKIADQARWVEKRQELHESAIANLPGLVAAARISVTYVETIHTVGLTRKSEGFVDEKAQGFTAAYRSLEGSLLEMESKLELYGSDESSKAYSQTVALLVRLSFEIEWLYYSDSPAEEQRVTAEQMTSIAEVLRDLTNAYEQYVSAARSDLRTNQ